MASKVLYDLSFANTKIGFSGIPQDARLLFNNLSFSDKIDLSGLLYSLNDLFFFKSDNKTEESALFLRHIILGDLIFDDSIIQRGIKQLFPLIHKLLVKYYNYRMNEFDINPIESDLFLDTIWRNMFSNTCPQEDKKQILEKKFFWSRLSTKKLIDIVLEESKSITLNTDGFDFIIFHDARYVKVSTMTKKIIRYHDAIPVYSSDVIIGSYQTKMHIKAIEKSAHDSIYVCNSTTSLDQLNELSPIAAEKARVIPYFIPRMEKPNVTVDILRSICIARTSKHTYDKNSDSNIDLWLKKSKTLPEFILSVATIEPRKNFIGLINAWLKLRYKTGRDIKLMIVGKPGWLFDKTLDAIRPFVKSGDLIHLEGIAQHELPYLYAAATCFVFPSFIEGFGLPPNEAMQCDCPVAVSDISAHRYSCGDAALYFDPYDIDDMANKIEILIDKKNNHSLITDLIKKGRKNVQRYSREALLPLWEEMFNELKNQK